MQGKSNLVSTIDDYSNLIEKVHLDDLNVYLDMLDM